MNILLHVCLNLPIQQPLDMQLYLPRQIQDTKNTTFT